MLVWHFGNVFKLLGDTQGVHLACIRAAGHDAADTSTHDDVLAQATVAVWKHRNRIPDYWMPAILHAWIAAGHDMRMLFTGAGQAEAPAHTRPGRPRKDKAAAPAPVATPARGDAS